MTSHFAFANARRKSRRGRAAADAFRGRLCGRTEEGAQCRASRNPPPVCNFETSGGGEGLHPARSSVRPIAAIRRAVGDIFHQRAHRSVPQKPYLRRAVVGKVIERGRRSPTPGTAGFSYRGSPIRRIEAVVRGCRGAQRHRFHGARQSAGAARALRGSATTFRPALMKQLEEAAAQR